MRSSRCGVWSSEKSQTAIFRRVNSFANLRNAAAAANDAFKPIRLLDWTKGSACVCKQRDNAVLRQHVLDLRRAVRAVGCDLNASATFFPLPVCRHNADHGCQSGTA